MIVDGVMLKLERRRGAVFDRESIAHTKSITTMGLFHSVAGAGVRELAVTKFAVRNAMNGGNTEWGVRDERGMISRGIARYQLGPEEQSGTTLPLLNRYLLQSFTCMNHDGYSQTSSR